MKAVILAGGEGTRLRPFTYTKPKPMVPFLNKPTIEHIITKLAKEGFDDIIITTNYMPEIIDSYFGDGSDFGVTIHTVSEKEPLGTAGSVKNAVRHLDETFAVIQGDNISEINIAALLEEHKSMDGKLTISLRQVDDVSHFGIAEMRGDEIIAYVEKPKPNEAKGNLANDGIYIIEPEVLEMIPLSFYDFSRNLFPQMLSKREKICGSVTNAFWKDIGTPRDYMDATRHFLEGENLIEESCSIEDSSISFSVLGERCSVIGSDVEGSVVFDSTTISKATLDGCIIGSGCVIEDEAIIGLGALIGDGCVIGKGSIIAPGTRIAPNMRLPAGAKAEGDNPQGGW